MLPAICNPAINVHNVCSCNGPAFTRSVFRIVRLVVDLMRPSTFSSLTNRKKASTSRMSAEMNDGGLSKVDILGLRVSVAAS